MNRLPTAEEVSAIVAEAFFELRQASAGKPFKVSGQELTEQELTVIEGCIQASMEDEHRTFNYVVQVMEMLGLPAFSDNQNKVESETEKNSDG